ncbi:hypothetical protein COI63_08770 [Bacillus toyonensis]|uniref:hypothetical protein n=1 Tax=Bacillus toyonensis TaxID=155322 RepID=UPI000BFB70D5|nr:hypothetical protein [Bacillus toyonensis]PHG14333.1 hypothetical protein COI63_08770 [Bacillus toyonensis]
MKRWKSSRIVVCFLFLTFIIAKCMNTEHSSTSNESSFKNEKNEVSRWYSQTPKTILSDADAKNDITTIKAIQKSGWKLLMQNGQPVSFNGNASGRNEIMEKSAINLINGGYEISLDNEGNIVDIKLNKDAEQLLGKQQKQIQSQRDQEKKNQEQSEHDHQYSVIQNNIDDIYRYVENGYRFKMSNDGNGTISTWNINHKNDNSPGLEYSINKLISLDISIKSDNKGKVTGFTFNQTDFYEDKFNLYDMTK